MKRFAVIALVVLGASGLASPVRADDSIGIFETILESSLSFDETVDALQATLDASDFDLHATHVVRVPEDKHRAKVFVLTSPRYLESASAESPRTISAQILRLAVFTSGDEQKTYVNMANPVAHAMVYYAGSPRYEALIAAAGEVAKGLRELAATVPGTAVSIQTEPRRDEKHYNSYNGDGPAKMMAKFRRWQKSQLLIFDDSAESFASTVDKVAAALAAGTIADAEEADGWEVVARIAPRDDIVYFGLSNPYAEDKMIGINSRFRKEGKSEASPYPGVDHVAALPLEVLVVRDGDKTLVLQYGEMWRMQLYFWDSGYRAFTANVGVPGKIVRSIEDAILTDR